MRKRSNCAHCRAVPRASLRLENTQTQEGNPPYCANRSVSKTRFYFKDAKFGPTNSRRSHRWKRTSCSCRRRHKIYHEYRRLPRRRLHGSIQFAKERLVFKRRLWQSELPPKAEHVWVRERKGHDRRSIDPRSGAIKEIVFRLRSRSEERKQTAAESDDDAPSPQPNPARHYPKGMRSSRPSHRCARQALTKNLRRHHTDRMCSSPSTQAMSTLKPVTTFAISASALSAHHRRGHLTQDLDLLRDSARELLALVFSCRPALIRRSRRRFAATLLRRRHLPKWQPRNSSPVSPKRA